MSDASWVNNFESHVESLMNGEADAHFLVLVKKVSDHFGVSHNDALDWVINYIDKKMEQDFHPN